MRCVRRFTAKKLSSLSHELSARPLLSRRRRYNPKSTGIEFESRGGMVWLRRNVTYARMKTKWNLKQYHFRNHQFVYVYAVIGREVGRSALRRQMRQRRPLRPSHALCSLATALRPAACITAGASPALLLPPGRLTSAPLPPRVPPL